MTTGEQLREVAAALKQDQRNYLHEVEQGKARIAELEQDCRNYLHEVEKLKARIVWLECEANTAPAVAGELVEALRLAANRLDRLTLEVSGGYWRSCAAEWTGEARAALAKKELSE